MEGFFDDFVAQFGTAVFVHDPLVVHRARSAAPPLLADADIAELPDVHACAILEGEDGFELLSERLCLNAEEILYVGDSEKKDVLGARNAGMKSLLITKDARKAKKSAADLVVSSYVEMREKLL